MSYHGDVRLGDTIDVKFTSRAFATGVPTTLAGTPSVAAYPGNSTTEITAGITLSVDFDSRTGLNNVRVVATSGNGYATATNYELVITAGTVGGTSVVGEVVGSFSIENRSALMPTTASRTLVVDAAGLADANMVKAGPTGSGTAQTAKDIGGAVPAAAAGASGGLLISGSNSGTTTLAALTVTGATTLTGNVVLSDGLTVSAPSTGNRSGITVTGNGTGHGVSITSGNGATGNGLHAVAGSTNGNGMNLLGTGTGNGILTTGGASAGGDGLEAAAGGGTDIRAAAITGTLATVTTATTATNLTNAPTAGDFTATMKTSIGTAVAASAVASVTGNVGGNVTGSVGSVVGAVGSVTGNVGGNVVGSVASVTAGVTIAAAQLFIKKNTALANFQFVMTDSTTHAPKTGVTVTATRSIDGGGFSGCANSVSEITSGWYQINLAAADVNGTVIALRFTGASSDDLNITLITQA